MPAAEPRPTRFALTTDDGLALRAERLDSHAGPSPVGVVLCHPHPLHGGNMYDHVIGGLFNDLAANGTTVVRFNFRATSGSEGRHDHGGNERLDILAAVECLADDGDNNPDRPVVVVGYSFGAGVALRSDHPSIGAWVAIAPPLPSTGGDDALTAVASTSRPKHLVVGSDDQIAVPSRLAERSRDWVNTSTTIIDGEDHFLATAHRRLSAIVTDAVDSLAT